MKFRIVLLIFDPYDTFTTTPEGVSKLLASIETLRGDYDLVIVNNTPVQQAPNTAKYLVSYTETNKDAQYVQHEENRGIAAGLNAGANWGNRDYDFLVMMSGDALVVDPDILLSIESLFSKYSRVGCLHPISLFEDSPNMCNYSRDFSMKQFQAHVAQGPAHCAREEAKISTQIDLILSKVKQSRAIIRYPLPTLPLTFLAIRANVFSSLNGFDETFLGGHENNDFVLRLTRSGYFAAIANQLFIYHRRLLFRSLGQAGINRSIYNQLASESERAWLQKYGKRNLLELYYEARYGPIFVRMILPFAIVCYKSLGRLGLVGGRKG